MNVTETEARLPHRFKARSYQIPILEALSSGVKRAVWVAHRRSGKDTVLLNFSVWSAHTRVGTYYHIFPYLNQGRKILWDGRNYDGMRFLDHFPPEIIRSKHEQEMRIDLLNGSIWQIVGSDNVNALVGTNVIGCVFSEYALQHPNAWEFLRPILRENRGWAAFCFTPRGRNHGWELYQRAVSDPEWFCELLTVRDTRRDGPGEDGQPIITPEDVDRERREGMPEPLVQQEYFCSFEAAAALQFLPGSLVQAAFDRQPQDFTWAPKIIGVDVARFGDDRSVILLRQGGRILEKVIFRALDTMQLAAQVCRMLECHRPAATFVDSGGVGGGVVDRCRQLGYPMVEVNSASKAGDAEHYANLRAEMWGKVREWLREMACLDPVRDKIVATELQGPEYRFDANNRILLEKKEDMKSRGLPSPDEADALALTFAAPVQSTAAKEWLRPRSARVDWDPLRPPYERSSIGAMSGANEWNPLA
jgi:hypothetical protein